MLYKNFILKSDNFLNGESKNIMKKCYYNYIKEKPIQMFIDKNITTIL